MISFCREELDQRDAQKSDGTLAEAQPRATCYAAEDGSDEILHL